MGNIGSHQTGHISSNLRTDSNNAGAFSGHHHHHHHHHHQAHGVRDQHYGGREPKPPQPQKVLPERDVHQKLRPTGNGEILLAGGTLSGRQHWQNGASGGVSGNGVYRSSSIPCGRVPGRPASGPVPGPHSPLPTNRSRYNPTNTQGDHQHHRYASKHAQQLRQIQMRRSGSEPDLRGAEYCDQNGEQHKHLRTKKKYKAPAPPSNNTSDKPSTDEERGSVDAESPARKTRLFKTHAQTKKKSSSPIANRNIIGKVPDVSTNITDITRQRSSENLSQLPPVTIDPIRSTGTAANRLHSHLPMVMQRTTISPDFHSELKAVTRRLNENTNKKRAMEEQREDKPEPNIAASETASKLKTLDHHLHRKEMLRSKIKELKAKEMALILDVRPPASGKESTPEQSPPKVKTFYFGMERMVEDQDLGNSLESEDISSESEEEASTHGGIALQLRPILPKKQLEIPSFSPAAAWRLLSSMDMDPRTGSTAAIEDGPVFYEDKIENSSKPPPPYPLQHIPQGPRSNNDKSGDSGISGDETPDAALLNPRYRGNSWTPQQDLGDDSSLEEGIIDTNAISPTKFASKPHVFSLSLPRENHLSTYIAERTSLQPFTSLQKLKKSVTGVLGHMSSAGANKRDSIAEQVDLIDPSDNWFLSRSAPNSLNNGFNSLELRRSKVPDIDLETIPSGNIPRAPQNSRRIMYLPQSPNTNSNINSNHRRKYMSKSYENLSTDLRIPQNLQDPPRLETGDKPREQPRKPKKFTFQSTVRQIERRRLAEKLSKEVERKEQQRIRELEAMQRVEEEFQKKRAREKATIRQQLRLYTMDDNSWSSLPPNIDLSEEVREEPDGAVSSNTASPTLAKMASENINVDFRGNAKASAAATTQILSEYRQPQREYREYRTNSGQNARHIMMEQTTTVHPKVTCNMPKATASSYTDNYRKDFAHGVKNVENEVPLSSNSRTQY